MDIFELKLVQFAKELLSFHVDCLNMLGIHLGHVPEHLALRALATHAHEFQRRRDERQNLAEVLLLQVFEGWSELDSLVPVDKRDLHLRERFVERFEAHLVLVLQGLVQLIVAVSEP